MKHFSRVTLDCEADILTAADILYRPFHIYLFYFLVEWASFFINCVKLASLLNSFSELEAQYALPAQYFDSLNTSFSRPS